MNITMKSHCYAVVTCKVKQIEVERFILVLARKGKLPIKEKEPLQLYLLFEESH